MRSISISDQTLLTPAARAAGFRQKLEAARKLDHLGVSAVEMPRLSNEEADMLLMRSLCSTVKRGALACQAGMTVQDVERAWEAVKGAKHPRLIVSMPLTAAQLEYIGHLKPPKALEKIGELVKKARAMCDDVEFVCGDITRAEEAYAAQAMKAAIEETNRRRTVQQRYNEEHHITPTTIKKAVRDLIAVSKDIAKKEKDWEKDPESMSKKELGQLIDSVEKQMKKAAADLNFEAAAKLRDKMIELKKELQKME